MHYVEIDGERHVFRFTTKAVRELERATGGSAFNLMGQQISMDLLATMFWAGRLHELPAMTHDHASTLIDAYIDEGGHLRNLFEAINGAYVEWAQKLMAPNQKAGAPKKVTPAKSKPSKSG